MEQTGPYSRGIGFGGGLGLFVGSQLLAILVVGPLLIPAFALGGLPRDSWIVASILMVGTSGPMAFLAVNQLGVWKVPLADLFQADPRIVRAIRWIPFGVIGHLMVTFGVTGFIASHSVWFDRALLKVEFPLKGPAPLLFVFGVFLAPVVEELMFRGVILHGMLRRYKPRNALLLSATLFALAHMEPVKLPFLFAFALGVGWLYQRTGSLWPPIAAHVFNNGIGFLGGSFSSKPTTAAMPLEQSLALTLGGLCFLYLAYRQLDWHWPRR